MNLQRLPNDTHLFPLNVFDILASNDSPAVTMLVPSHSVSFSEMRCGIEVNLL